MILKYSELTRLEMEQINKEETIVLIPLGALEQHGNQAPLGTDDIIAQAMTEYLTRALEAEDPDFPMLIFPVIPVGLSTEHKNFCGSITLKPDTYYHMLYDISISLAHHGFKKLAFLICHGGNAPIVQVLSRELRSELGISPFILTSGAFTHPDVTATISEGNIWDFHGGEMETSMVMAVDESDKIIEFVEKPANPPAMPGDATKSLASMGIYIFNADYLYELLEEDDKDDTSSHDFGKDIIPKITKAGMAYAHPFPLSCVQSDPESEPYWRDVGTLEAYWKANLDLASVTPELDMYDQDWPIRTHMESLPPAKFVQDRSGSHGMTLNSLVSGGCIISGSVVVQSVLFPRVRVNSFCNIDSAVLLPEVWVGRSCRLRRCIIDRACVIPEGMVIGENAEEDARRFYRSEEGIVLVTREMLRKLQVKQER